MTDKIKRIGAGTRLSECTVCDGRIYISGQVDFEAHPTVCEQTTAVLRLIDELLEQAGSDKHHILDMTVYLSKISSFQEMNLAWQAWVSPSSPPSRTVVESAQTDPNWLVKISAIATVSV